MSFTHSAANNAYNDHAFALVDCNNFFVSCERVFDPKLRNRAVVVLSSNDGCIVSRSQEAKKLGIPMGAPLHEYLPLMLAHNVAIFSSNFVLYGDMSNRVMDALDQFTPYKEIYSIDEAFLELNFIDPAERSRYARIIRETVIQQTGIPISIGIAPTKTLSKIANRVAKTSPEWNGVLSLYDAHNVDEILKITEVRDIWGIGRRLALRLRAEGIYNAYDLKCAPDKWIRKNLSVTGLRMVLELRGTPCAELAYRSPKKSITSSRSFGRPVEKIAALEESIAHHATRIGEKLREEELCARLLFVHFRTSYFRDGPRHNVTEGTVLIVPTAHTPKLIAAAQKVLKRTFKPSFAYTKSGIIVNDLVSDSHIQQDLFVVEETREKEEKLMRLIDSVNQLDGKRTIFFGASGANHSWSAKHDRRSQNFISSWDELPRVRA